MMKKNIFAIALIVVGVIGVFGVSIGFHSYTDDFTMVEVLVDNPETGEVDAVWHPITKVDVDKDRISMKKNPETGKEEMVTRPPLWRDGEIPMELSTMRVIAAIAGALSLIGGILFLVFQVPTMKRQDVIGLLFILLGVLTVMGTLTAFYPCTEQMPGSARAMRCVWTMRVLFGIAGMISVSGIVMLLVRRARDIVIGLNMAVILAGSLFLLTPTVATGVCAAPMDCVYTFKPFTLVMGSVIVLVAVIGALLLRKRREVDEESDTFNNL